LKAPAHLAGTSLKPLLEKPDAAWNRPAFTQVWRGQFAGHSIRTERYRYTEWDHGKQGAELYDYQTDPGELQNLAKDPKHATTIAELKALVQKNWADEFNPPHKKPGKKK
jgi:iduronate 2-sulfatase